MTPRTAHYYEAGEIASTSNPVWLVCHGYGHLASNFIRLFDGVAARGHLVLAPEALSRFYLRVGSGRVGASWMTKHAREDEINDYVRYLDGVLRDAEERRGTLFHDVIGLGFSQGVATISRWAAHSERRVKALVLWSGSLPPDVDWPIFGPRGSRIHLVRGSKDEIYSEEKYAADEALLFSSGIDFERSVFDGGHELDGRTLTDLVTRIG